MEGYLAGVRHRMDPLRWTDDGGGFQAHEPAVDWKWKPDLERGGLAGRPPIVPPTTKTRGACRSQTNCCSNDLVLLVEMPACPLVQQWWWCYFPVREKSRIEQC